MATIESIGSSTHIEGAELTDREIEHLLSNLDNQSFANRDEEALAKNGQLERHGAGRGTWYSLA